MTFIPGQNLICPPGQFWISTDTKAGYRALMGMGTGSRARIWVGEGATRIYMEREYASEQNAALTRKIILAINISIKGPT